MFLFTVPTVVSSLPFGTLSPESSLDPSVLQLLLISADELGVVVSLNVSAEILRLTRLALLEQLTLLNVLVCLGPLTVLVLDFPGPGATVSWMFLCR